MRLPAPKSMRTTFAVLAAVALGAASPATGDAQPTPPLPTAQELGAWEIHDMKRPAPPAVTPGAGGSVAQAPPSDAIVLFDGKDLSKWESDNGGPAKWTVENGYFQVTRRTGGIHTKQGFGDVQLHVEWTAPSPARGEGQGRGNSGIFLMGRYEVQVLDSYQSATYPDGQASALYGQWPPMVNATRPPGEWNVYDIIFRAPRFADDGKLLSPVMVTVFHNGVLVQDHRVMTGPSGHHARPPYEKHDAKLPLGLQDHGDPVRFRNIWVRELGGK